MGEGKEVKSVTGCLLGTGLEPRPGVCFAEGVPAGPAGRPIAVSSAGCRIKPILMQLDCL